MTNDIVIVDSALFKNDLSDKALSFINGKTVIISSSFYCEAAAYSAILDKERANTLRKNIACLLKASKHGTNLVTYPTPFDIYTTAVASAEQGKRICVMTEDVLLIERLCMKAAPVRIFDLNTNSYEKVTPRSTTCHVEHKTSSTEVSGVFSMQGAMLINGDGKRVTLSQRLCGGTEQEDIGMESAVYDIEGQPEHVAKIYRYYPSVQKQMHLKKLRMLSYEMNCPWCLLPQELLYRDGKLIGFTMTKKKTNMLSKDTLYLGNEQIIESDRLSVKKSYSLGFAKMMLTQIKILSCYGISICDYNPNNFSMYYAGTPVVMFDTDSFVLGNYFSNSIDDAAAFTCAYKHDDKMQLTEMVIEEALIFTFRLLSLGANPIIRTGYPYVFSNPKSLLIYRRSYFPENIVKYFDRVFTGCESASISLALYALSEAVQELHDHPEKDITIKKMIESACISEQKLSYTSMTVSTDRMGVAYQKTINDKDNSPTMPKQTVSSPSKPHSGAFKWVLRAAAIAALCIGIGCWLTSTGIMSF